MTRPSYSFLACLVLLPVVEAGTKRITLEQTSGRGGVSLRGSPPAWRWADDGEHLVLGRKPDAKWVDPRTFAESDPKPTPDDGEDDALAKRHEAALAALEDVKRSAAKALLRRPADRSDDGSVLLLRGLGGLYIVDGDEATPLERTGELEDLSPNGRTLAFVRDNDLILWSAEKGEVAVTEDGSADRFHGKLDWVYQEELYGRGRFKAFWWSPDSRHVAFLSFDESPVHEFTVVDHIEKGHFRVKPEVTNYPKAGDPNPIVSLSVHEVATGNTRAIDLAKYADDEPLIVRVDWAPSGELLFIVQDRIQTWADLNACDVDTLQWTTWIHETNDSWVERPSAPRFLADGSYLWLSNRTDHQHLYHYRGGELVRQVTDGDHSVRGIDHVDEESGRIWFTSNRDGAVNSNLYRIGLDGRGFKRLTRGDYSHSTSFNADRTMFLDTYSSLDQVPAIRLCDGDGKVLRELGEAKIAALDEYDLSTWELHEVKARDGFKLDVALLKPTPFSRSKRYPVFIPTYSGPDAPSVRNRWNSSSYHQFLAQNGYVVLQVNVRTASGKGHHAIEQCYKRLGVQELKDLEDVVDWITGNRWADESRVGIGGYSYGGFMAAYALTHSDRFALGIAGGGVFDWRMYDTIYTERYMSTPQKNKGGYEETSVLDSAKDLKGHLLIHHGVMDDNVHVQNAMQLVFALQKAGKSFDFMLYPQSRHGVGDREQRWHLRQLEWKTMQEALGGAHEPL